ncbi:MAG: hypothetical protein HY952_09535 [Elusimicrobia bacterium]|nr:hypothetical protein [Elusimicrobiota bacterium]
MNKIAFVFMLALAAAPLAGCNRAPKDGSAAKGSLSSVRSALQTYYGDAEGVFPDNLGAVSGGGKYLAALPKLKLPGHGETADVLYLSGPAIDPAKLTDTGGYAYYNDKNYPQTYGALIINCTHKDPKGNFMYSF